VEATPPVALSAPPLPPPPHEIVESLDAKMHGLLDRAIEQSTTASRQELFHKILDQIVPDEARIIGPQRCAGACARRGSRGRQQPARRDENRSVTIR
jgi:hypothetical protein